MFDSITKGFHRLREGGERYYGVTRVALSLEKLYRQYRQQAEEMPEALRQSYLEHIHQQGAKKVYQVFHDNGAIWVKFGQFLSSRTDILPMPYVRALEKLQDDVEPVPFDEIEPVLLAEWGKDWRQHFTQFDEQAVAAASVAQVHKATLTNGRQVAVKIQLPQAKEWFKQDSIVFSSVSKVADLLISQFDLNQVTEQILSMTLSELDFLNEEANLKKFAALKHHPIIYVPEVFDDLSTSQIMVTEWVNGIKLKDYLVQNPSESEALLQNLLRSYIQQITGFGVYHADPHPGNFIVMGDGRVAVLDYGALGYLSAEETTHYATLLQVLFGKMQASESLGELFLKAGFKARDQKVFQEVAELVLKESVRDLESTEILAIALEKMRDLKIQIPDSFVALARVILTFGGLLTKYQVSMQQ